MHDHPIRLVCPACEAIHRVRRITLGKLYRCKKCHTGLVTLDPAVLHCPACHRTTPTGQIDVSRMQTCGACPSAPLLEVVFPHAGPEEIRTTAVAGDWSAEPARRVNAAPLSPSAARPAAPQPAMSSSDDWDDLGAASSESSSYHIPDPSARAATTPPARPTSATGTMKTPLPIPVPADTNGGAFPALAGQEDRAVKVLQQVFDKLQTPLIKEIERTRQSIPTWLFLVVMVPVCAGFGFLIAALMRAQDQTAKAEQTSQSIHVLLQDTVARYEGDKAENKNRLEKDAKTIEDRMAELQFRQKQQREREEAWEKEKQRLLNDRDAMRQAADQFLARIRQLEDQLQRERAAKR